MESRFQKHDTRSVQHTCTHVIPLGGRITGTLSPDHCILAHPTPATPIVLSEWLFEESGGLFDFVWWKCRSKITFLVTDVLRVKGVGKLRG